MSADAPPAWLGLFPDRDYEFSFGVRPGDAVGFFADTSEHASLMDGRRTALEESSAQCLFEEPSVAEAVVECSDWAGLDGSGCRELTLHWEPDFLILFRMKTGGLFFARARCAFPRLGGRRKKLGCPFMRSTRRCPRSTKTSARALISSSPTSRSARRGSVPTGA